MRRSSVVPLVLLLLDACAHPPAQLAVGPFADIRVGQAQEQDLIGQRVRWGGTIVATDTNKDDTCFEVVSRPLDDQARPRQTDETEGRFIACAAGFYDPAIYASGREITVVGALEAAAVGKIGQHDYRYPRVNAEHVHLWPQREMEWPQVYYRPWIDPFWYPYWAVRVY